MLQLFPSAICPLDLLQLNQSSCKGHLPGEEEKKTSWTFVDEATGWSDTDRNEQLGSLMGEEGPEPEPDLRL